MAKKTDDTKPDKMSLLDRIKKSSTIKDSSLLSSSRFIHDREMVPTPVPMINVALSGRVDGGFTSGITMWAGPSKHFKTAFSLLMAKSYMDKYPESILLFYDSEFGTPKKYFEAFGIDMDRVVHSPIMNVEQLKFDIVKQLNDLEVGDKVIIVVDSIGNLASKKEIEDSLEEKAVADMTRAKQIKSMFRMVTPYLSVKDVPMVVVNHTYKTMEMYSKDVVGGGTGSYYSADNIYIIGRQQEKDGKEVVGYDFIINVEKSRFSKEKSKIPISVSYEGGIERFSGLMEIALESGHVDKPSQGWYSKVDKKTGEMGPNLRLSDTMNSEFWGSILNDDEFKDIVNKKFSVAYGSILGDSKKTVHEEEYDEL